MLRKINNNFGFVNTYNGFVENDLLGIENDFSIIFKYCSENQKMIIKRYLKYGLLENVKIFMKNIARKKINEIKNYMENDIKF